MSSITTTGGHMYDCAFHWCMEDLPDAENVFWSLGQGAAPRSNYKRHGIIDIVVTKLPDDQHWGIYPIVITFVSDEAAVMFRLKHMITGIHHK